MASLPMIRDRRPDLQRSMLKPPHPPPTSITQKCPQPTGDRYNSYFWKISFLWAITVKHRRLFRSQSMVISLLDDSSYRRSCSLDDPSSEWSLRMAFSLYCAPHFMQYAGYFFVISKQINPRLTKPHRAWTVRTFNLHKLQYTCLQRRINYFNVCRVPKNCTVRVKKQFL